MGERLAAGNVALALLANTIATGAALVAIILAFGPISGAHLNPAVTLADAWQGGIAWRETPAYIAAQIAGAFAGVATAHLMFGLTLFTCFDARPHRLRSALQRVHRYLRFALCDLGMRQAPALCRSLRCGCLHHRRILVYRIYFLRQPSRHPCPIREQHVCRYQTRRYSRDLSSPSWLGRSRQRCSSGG